MHTEAVKLSADQIADKTRDWPEDAISDLIHRIWSAKYGDCDPAVERAWHEGIQRRTVELESSQVQRIPLEEALARARTLIGR
jgi:hypothetical protein